MKPSAPIRYKCPLCMRETVMVEINPKQRRLVRHCLGMGCSYLEKQPVTLAEMRKWQCDYKVGWWKVS